jgi:hypothetical protein
MSRFDDQLDPEIPDGLRSDLTALGRKDISVPAEIDRAILNRARAHFARRSRLHWLVPLSAAAAMLLICLTLVPAISRSRRSAAPLASSSTVAGDMNHDGVIDIRDALLLARRLDAGPVAATKLDDLNHDGVIDRRDVDAIAAIAVKLNDRGAVR